MINQFGSVHADDLILIGQAAHRVNLMTIDNDAVVKREMAALQESITGTKRSITHLTKDGE